MKTKTVENITDSPLSSDFLPGGELGPGKTAEVPVEQPDGSELHWPPEYFKDVVEKKTAAKSSKEE